MKQENKGFLLLEVLIAAVLLSVFSSVVFQGFLAGCRMEKDAEIEELLLLSAKKRTVFADMCIWVPVTTMMLQLSCIPMWECLPAVRPSGKMQQQSSICSPGIRSPCFGTNWLWHPCG